MWGDPTLSIDLSRHNNEQRHGFQYSPNPDYIGSEGREFTVIQSVSCLATLLKDTMTYCSLMWQAEIFSVPFLFLSPSSQPALDIEAFATVLFTEARRESPLIFLRNKSAAADWEGGRVHQPRPGVSWRRDGGGRGARGVEGGGQPCDPLHFWQWHHMQTSLEPASRAGLIKSTQSLSGTRR